MNGSRLLVIFSDGSSKFYENGIEIWRRDDGLGDIASSVFLEPNSASTLDADEIGIPLNHSELTVFERYTDRWAAHFKMVTLTTEGDKVSDVHGFSKLFIGASRAGKIFALNTLNGRILWAKFLPGCKPMKVMVLRHAHMRNPPIVGVVCGSPSVLWSYQGNRIYHH